jgi:Ca2+-binding EF-hand superfamily protein
MPPVVQALDLNRDGSLTPDELASAPESLKTLDQDGDGTLSPEELRPQGPPPPMGENPPVE